MARVWVLGYELGNVTTNNTEYTSRTGSPVIQSTTVRTGGFAGQITGMSSGTRMAWGWARSNTNSNGPFFQRFYLRVDTPPSAANRIIALVGANTFTDAPVIWIELNSDGSLSLFDEDGQIGSASAALSASTWYRVELKYDRTPAAGSHVVEAKINGTVFATSSARNLSTGTMQINWGGNLAAEAQTTGNWYFDDVCENNGNGSFENSYPGEGGLIALFPNAAGDNNMWLKTDGSAGDSNNYQLVDDAPPNITDYIKSTTLDDIDDYNIADSGLASDSVVKVVTVNVYFGLDAATGGADPEFVFRVKAASGGTVEESTSPSPNITAQRTNNRSVSLNPRLVLYDLPGASTVKWTVADLDTAQIGVRVTGGGVDLVRVYAMWMYVEYRAPVSSASASVSPSSSASASTSPSASISSSISPSASISPSSSNSPSASISPSSSSSASRSPSSSASPSRSPSASISPRSSRSPSSSVSPSSPPFGAVLRRYESGSWVKAKLMTFTNGSFQNKPMAYREGNSWIDVDVFG